MAETSMNLTGEEREYLVRLLNTALKELRVEEHRTRTPSFREHMLNDEKIIAGLLGKLGTPAA
jgi:hypothetical protein